MTHSQTRKRSFSATGGLLALLLLLGNQGFSAEYYVSPNGDNANAGTSPSAPWRSIAKANGVLRAGDVVHLRGGEYIDDPIAPQRSGEAGKPITYTAYQGEEPVVTSNTVGGLQYALELKDVAHIVIEKVTVTGRRPAPNVTIKMFAHLSNASHIEIRDSEFRYAEGWSGIRLIDGSHHNKLLRNRIDFVGTYDLDGEDFGDAIMIAKDSHHNLIASNYLTHAAHNLLRTAGSYNIAQDNTFDNDWSDVEGPGKGGRNLTFDGTHNLFQRNIVRNAATSSDAPKNSGMKVEGTSNIMRRNVLRDNHHDAISSETGSWQAHARDNHIYHNTIYNNGASAWRIVFYETDKHDNWPRDNVFINNVVFSNRQDPRNDVEDVEFRIVLNDSPVQVPAGNRIVNNLVAKSSSNDARIYLTPPLAKVSLRDAESTYGNFIADNIQQPPVFAKQRPLVIDDFELAPGSPGLDAAAPLARTLSSGYGSRVPVDDAGYFVDGYGLIPGDVIRIGSERDVRILRVDYQANEVAVDRDVGWAEGDAVTLEFEGAAPDIGAVEAGRATQLTLKPKAPTLFATPVPSF